MQHHYLTVPMSGKSLWDGACADDLEGVFTLGRDVSDWSSDDSALQCVRCESALYRSLLYIHVYMHTYSQTQRERERKRERSVLQCLLYPGSLLFLSQFLSGQRVVAS